VDSNADRKKKGLGIIRPGPGFQLPLRGSPALTVRKAGRESKTPKRGTSGSAENHHNRCAQRKRPRNEPEAEGIRPTGLGWGMGAGNRLYPLHENSAPTTPDMPYPPRPLAQAPIHPHKSVFTGVTDRRSKKHTGDNGQLAVA
jgi:hypothetical protein